MQALLGNISKPALKRQATRAAIDCRRAPCTLVTVPSAVTPPPGFINNHPWLVPHPKRKPAPDDLLKAYRIPFAPYPHYSKQEKWDIFERWILAFKKAYKSEKQMMLRFEVFCDELDNIGQLWSTNQERIRIVKQDLTPDRMRFLRKAERLKFRPGKYSDVNPRVTLHANPKNTDDDWDDSEDEMGYYRYEPARRPDRRLYC